MICNRGLLCNQKRGEYGVGYETTSGRHGASVLLLLLISVCLFCHLTNRIISSEFKPLLPLPLQSFSLFALLLTSIFLSLSPLRSFSVLPAPGPQTAWLNTQANVSLFKETQVVDMLAMGQDQNEELL